MTQTSCSSPWNAACWTSSNPTPSYAQMLRPQHAHVLKGDYNSGQLLSLVGHCDFAVGMRLHFLLFAALAGRPLRRTALFRQGERPPHRTPCGDAPYQPCQRRPASRVHRPVLGQQDRPCRRSTRSHLPRLKSGGTQDKQAGGVPADTAAGQRRGAHCATNEYVGQTVEGHRACLH